MPITVKDPSRLRRPQLNGGQDKARFPILSSLFSSGNGNKGTILRGRPLRPDVPAQTPLVRRNGFYPLPARRREVKKQSEAPYLLDSSEFNDRIGEFETDSKEEIRNYISSRPLPMRRALLQKNPRSLVKRSAEEDMVNCTWGIETERNLYLLVTFHNLSAPFTVDCEGAYIEVERENNGFEARWCGNRVTQGGSRPHVIFARNEVRISVFDDGVEGKILPTGFNADVEVIDLFDAGQYTSLRRSNAYSRVRQISGRDL